MTPRELTRLRCALGWSQTRLAQAIGVNRFDQPAGFNVFTQVDYLCVDSTPYRSVPLR